MVRSRNDAGERTEDPEGVERTGEPEDTGVDALRRELEEQRQRHLRVLADFDNFRRRAAREDGSAHQQGRRAALLPLLGVIDTLERALETGSTDASFYEGIVATHRQLLNALREAGAEPIEGVGQTFDPRLHEIVATVPAEDEEVEPRTVVREVRRGWRLGDDLLRPAQVVIAVPREDVGSWR